MPVDLLQKKRQVGGAPAPAPVAGGAPAPQQPQAPAQPARSGSGFVGFDRYLQANRQGAQNMATTVGDAVEKSGQEAVGALQGGTDTFAAKSQGVGTGGAPPTTYTGPKTWEEAGVDVGDVTKKVVDASGKVSSLGTPGGVASLLKESYNGPTTAGGSALDAALTGAAGGQRFQQLNTAYGDLTQRLLDASGGAGKLYDQRVAETEAAAARYAVQEQDRRLAYQDELGQRAGVGRDLQDGVWTRDEADTLDDIKRGKTRRVGG
jgi:hypothetical protein